MSHSRSGYVPGTPALSRIERHLAAHPRTIRLGISPDQRPFCLVKGGGPPTEFAGVHSGGCRVTALRDTP